MKYLDKFVGLITGLIYVIVMPMARIAKKHPIAFGLAMVLHMALVVGLFYAVVEQWEMPEQKAGAQQSVPTKAVTIDVEVIKAERQRLVDLEKKRQDKLESEIEQSEAAKTAQKHAEEHRKDEEKKAKEATKKKQLADEERKVTEAKTAEASKKKELAEADALEAEKQKQLADEVRKETEQKAAEAAVKAEEAEAKAREAEEQEQLAKQLTEEERKKKEQLEQQRAAEAQAFEKDQEARSLTQEIQAEEDHERDLVIEDQFSKLKSSYIGLIAARVKDEWRYMGAEDDWGCDVYIIQDEDGYVEAVNVQGCTIDDSDKAASFRNSIERAVYKASPLPMAPDQSVFDTEIMFFFRVN
ncbi:MAG: cell envelope integrity protein TolA [Gammaproteobacteria bacterium]